MLDEATAPASPGVLADKGFQAGDRVGIMLPNVPYFAVCYYGVLRAGGVVVPMNVLLKRREVAFYLRDPGPSCCSPGRGSPTTPRPARDEAGAECVIVSAGRVRGAARRGAEPRRDVVDRDADDTAVILYTSGTTGTPKGAELTHANLQRNARCRATMFGLGSDGVTLGALPLFHSFGQTCGINATIAAGGTLTLIPRFDPGKALEIIQRDGSTCSRACRRCTTRCCTTPSATSSTPRRSSSARPAARRCRSS